MKQLKVKSSIVIKTVEDLFLDTVKVLNIIFDLLQICINYSSDNLMLGSHTEGFFFNIFLHALIMT